MLFELVIRNVSFSALIPSPVNTSICFPIIEGPSSKAEKTILFHGSGKVGMFSFGKVGMFSFDPCSCSINDISTAIVPTTRSFPAQSQYKIQRLNVQRFR